MKEPLNRRNFLQISSLSGVGLLLGWSRAASANTLHNISVSKNLEITPFIQIEPTGKITLFAHKPDMGQGTYQAIPVILAEELGVSLEQVHIVFSKGEKKFGDQTSGGSNSVKGSYDQLRIAGAAAREMLIAVASKRWGVNSSECITAEGKVWHKSTNRVLVFGELATEASALEVPASPQLKNPANFEYIGKPLARPDIPSKVNGKAVFGMDVTLQGMLYASIERCPVFGGKVKAFDGSAAMKIKGVKAVLKTDRKLENNVVEGSGVAVVADSYWAALKARKALVIEWDYAGNDKVSSDSITANFQNLAQQEGVIDKAWGDFDKTYQEATTTLDATYETPFLAHSPMEPQNALAYIQGNKCEVWISSQGPDLVRDSLAQYMKLNPEDITVNIQFSGGGFGRRLFPDVACEAAMLSKSMNAPVKVIWTREDDTSKGPFRPSTYSQLKAALSADGKATAFQHKVVSPSIMDYLYQSHDKAKAAGEMTEGISDMSYNIPHVKNTYVFVQNTIPLGWWRAVTSTTTAFSHESFIDEMAHKAGKDPIDFRLNQLTNKGHVFTILNTLKEKSDWNKPLPKGWGRGVAVWEFFAGVCGQVVEVSRQEKGVKIEKVTAVIHCGTVINPSNVKAQVEGAIIMALTAATKDAIIFDKGMATNSNFHDYRMARINEVPPVIDIHILVDGTKPNGVGEPGLPPFAPALCNAIYQATGKRIRKLPFDIDNVV
jgi:isoquinoline 1-oxidoreductase beta subunit